MRIERILASVDDERKQARFYTRADGGRDEAKDESNADERAVGAKRRGCFRAMIQAPHDGGRRTRRRRPSRRFSFAIFSTPTCVIRRRRLSRTAFFRLGAADSKRNFCLFSLLAALINFIGKKIQNSAFSSRRHTSQKSTLNAKYQK